MNITHIHTFLVHPRKNEENDETPVGTSVLLSGKLFDLLNKVFTKSDDECRIEISFNPTVDGASPNSAREKILDFQFNPCEGTAAPIANMLENATTKRSGLGLLFLISGKSDNLEKLVISRFPADNGILADESGNGLNVEFLEKVFMKNSHSYKSVVFSDRTLLSGFWSGKVVDRQISTPGTPTSNYWIADFLNSDFKVTSEAGTRRFAEAIRKAAHGTHLLEVKKELNAIATLVPNINGKQGSISSILDDFNVSNSARDAVVASLKNTRQAAESFVFNRDEFRNHISFRTIQLDNGAMVTADALNFNSLVTVEMVNPSDNVERYSIEGKAVNDKLKKNA